MTADYRCTDSTTIQRHDATTDQWHAVRNRTVGGSDIAAVLDEGTYRGQTPWMVWADKNGMLDPPDARTRALFARGHALEPTVVGLFLDERPELGVRNLGLQESKLVSGVTASVDRLTSDGGGLECKTTTTNSVNWWPGDGSVPPQYRHQPQHYMAVTGRTHWWLAVLVIDAWKLYTWRIERDEAMVSRILDGAHRFLTKYLWAGVEPPRSGAPAEVKQRFRQDDGSVMEPDGQVAERVAQLVARRKDLKREAAVLDDEVTQIDDELRGIIGEHESVRFDGKTWATWRTSTVRRFDTTAFKRDHRDLWERYAVGSPQRTLRTP